MRWKTGWLLYLNTRDPYIGPVLCCLCRNWISQSPNSHFLSYFIAYSVLPSLTSVWSVISAHSLTPFERNDWWLPKQVLNASFYQMKLWHSFSFAFWYKTNAKQCRSVVVVLICSQSFCNTVAVLFYEWWIFVYNVIKTCNLVLNLHVKST